MNRNLLPRSVFAVLALIGHAAALAGPQQGVRCAAGVKGEILPGGPVLRCHKEVQIERPAVCTAEAFRAAHKPLPPDANGGSLIRTSGLDVCQYHQGRPDWVVAPPIPKRESDDPGRGEFEQIPLPGADVFRALSKVYEFPQDGPVYNPFHKPKLGVRCPAGWNAVPMGTIALRCEKLDGPSVQADCDALWTRDNDKRGLEDRCLGLNEGPTKPRGITKVQFDIDRARDDVSWHLQEQAGVDRWQRKVYAYPVSSN